MPILAIRFRSVLGALKGDLEQLAVDIQLLLRLDRVADPHRTRAPVTREPIDLALGEDPPTIEAVDRLQLLGTARRGALDEISEPTRHVLEAEVAHDLD